VRYSIVAPDRQRSECGHSVTTRRPLRMFQKAPREWAVDGTPVDCVRLAMTKLAPDAQLVLSGVNDGGNLGVDLLMSGTFAAAKEAFLRGLPAVAISHYRHPQRPRTWDHVPAWIYDLLTEAITHVPQGPFLRNVNLPAIDPGDSPPRQICDVDDSPMDVQFMDLESQGFQFTSNYQNRPRKMGSDVAHCFAGKLTISHLHEPLARQ